MSSSKTEKQWLDQPMNSGVTKPLYQGMKWLLLGAATAYVMDAGLTHLSRAYQFPRPTIVTPAEYGGYANEEQRRYGIVLNTEPKIDVEQNNDGLEVRLTDGDGFYPDEGWSNPTLSVYGFSPAGFPRTLTTRTTFLSETTNQVAFSGIELPKGDHLLHIHYHETSGLTNNIYKEIEVK